MTQSLSSTSPAFCALAGAAGVLCFATSKMSAQLEHIAPDGHMIVYSGHILLARVAAVICAASRQERMADCMLHRSRGTLMFVNLLHRFAYSSIQYHHAARLRQPGPRFGLEVSQTCNTFSWHWPVQNQHMCICALQCSPQSFEGTADNKCTTCINGCIPSHTGG